MQNFKEWFTFSLPLKGSLQNTLLKGGAFLLSIFLLAGMPWPKSTKTLACMTWFVLGLLYFIHNSKKDDYCRIISLFLIGILTLSIFIAFIK